MLLTIVSFILVFGVIVFVHEFGHFITAKKNDVKVLEFSLGMGPAIFKKQNGETLYALRAFPIGGYCSMEGENEDSEDPRSFSQKKPWQRLMVLFAGAFNNFLLAYLLLVIVMFGMGHASNTVNDVIKDYPAEAAGILAGDEIVAIDGVEITTWEEVVKSIDESGGNTLAITVLRDDVQNTIEVTPVLDGNYKVGITSKPVKEFGRSFYYAGAEFKALFTGIFDFFIHLGSGQVDGELVGPVGIVNIIGQASKNGFLNLLYITAYISINLGIVNLLPFPALDGGRIVFVLIEKIKGSPVDRTKEGYVHLVGMSLLMILTLFLVFKDISKL